MSAFAPLFIALFFPYSLFGMLDRVWPVPKLPPHLEMQVAVKPSPKPTDIPISTPKSIIVVSPTPIPTPTVKPTSTPTATPTPSLTSKPTPSVTGSIRDFLMNGINNFRKSKGLAAVSTDSYTCNFADLRAKEITSGFNHDGFNNRISSHSLPYPLYHYVVENLAKASRFQDVVNMWINSPGHAQNLLVDVTHGCIGSSGNYFVYEGWKP